MAAKVDWSDRSFENLEAIHDYIAENSPTYALRFITSLVLSVNSQLASFPESGRRIPEFTNTPINFLREVIFKNYRVVYNYNPSKNQLTIIAVVNAQMDFPEQIKPEWVL